MTVHVYDHIIPYIARDAAKRLCSQAAIERGDHQRKKEASAAKQRAEAAMAAMAKQKGKAPMAGPSQPKPPVPSSSKGTEQISTQGEIERLDRELISYRDDFLDYTDSPPAGEPDIDMNIPTEVGMSNSPQEEMDFDTSEIYWDWLQVAVSRGGCNSNNIMLLLCI